VLKHIHCFEVGARSFPIEPSKLAMEPSKLTTVDIETVSQSDLALKDPLVKDVSWPDFCDNLVEVVVSEDNQQNGPKSGGLEDDREVRCDSVATRPIATTLNEISSVPAFSFVATSNAKALTATQVPTSMARPLRDIIKASEAFSTAYGLPSRYGYPQAKPTDSARPIVIQGSGHGQHEIPAFAAEWGLVSALVEAYNRHHELVLRPDDLWQAILTQFSFYVNANAEELRDRFVEFEGQKELVVTMGGTLFTADYAKFARIMVDDNIMKNIKDPSIASWLLPAFSTTTEADRVAASVSVMSTFQAYFSYRCCLMCGIPKVTLLGSPEDWVNLRAKIDRLPEFDSPEGCLKKWHQLLVPVLDEFVLSAQGSPNIEFWDRICCHLGGGSGPRYLSGWVTVFSVFSAKGVWQGDLRPEDDRQVRRTKNPFDREDRTTDNDSHKAEKAEQALWPKIDTNDLPLGVLMVPVLVDDNGVEYDTKMFAGQFAYEAIGNHGTALRPRTDWCIAYEGKPKA